MDDIRRQDLKLFIREMIAPSRIIASVIAGLFFYLFWRVGSGFEPGIPVRALLSWVAILIAHISIAYNASVKRRFISKRFDALWQGCQDRLNRFEEVLKKLRKEQIADLSEMPSTIRRVAHSIYGALRRA